MRHIRTRRRFKVILILLFIICSTVLVENSIEALIPQMKSLAEARVEDALGGKVDFSIGSIGGGITRPIVLNDIRINQKGAPQFADSLVIDRISTNYYVKDVIKAIGGSELPPILDKEAHTYISLSTKGEDIKVFAGLCGDLSGLRVDGYLVLHRRDKINFSGYLKGSRFYAEVRPEKRGAGSVRAFGMLNPDKTFTLNLKFDHLKALGFDIVCDAVLKNKFVENSDPSKPGRLEGSLEATKVILNFKPFFDVRTSYWLGRDYVEILSLNIGDALKAYGRVPLKGSGDIDLTLLADNVNLTSLAIMLGKKEALSVLTGTLSGKFELKGPVKKARMNSVFNIRSGMIGPLDFDSLSATLKGELPFVKIEDSRITRKSGYLALAGEFDLRRAGKNNIFDNIKMITDDTAITWDEWSSTRGKDVQELNMTKNLGGQFGVGFKKFMREDKIDESLRDSDEVHFDYNLQPNDSLKVKVGQDKDFFGFEHKDKF